MQAAITLKQCLIKHTIETPISCENKAATVTVPLGDWLEKKKLPAIIIKQQFGFPMSTT